MTKSLIDSLLEETRGSTKTTLKITKVDKAAIELFAKKGYSNTSTREIAERAKVSEGTIFKHYKTKENLLKHLMLRFIKFLVPVVRGDFLSDMEKVDYSNTHEFLESFIDNRIKFVKKNISIFRVFVKEIVYDDKFRKSLVENYLDEAEKALYGLLDKLRDKGELKNISNEDFLNLLLKVVLADFVWTYALSNNYKNIDEEKWRTKMINQILRGIDQ